MTKIIIHPERIADLFFIFELCPYGAMKFDAAGNLIIGNECKGCKVCVKNGPAGAFECINS